MPGIHRFYLGYAAIGIVQLVLTVISVYILEFDIGVLFTPALFLLLGVNI
jgi:TM2 domain-containing membrane protein YozV